MHFETNVDILQQLLYNGIAPATVGHGRNKDDDYSDLERSRFLGLQQMWISLSRIHEELQNTSP